MFDRWKEKLAAKKAKDQAIAESQYWKTHPRLRDCLQAMRGSCTVAPADMHEAAIAAVNIALGEDSWKTAQSMPEDFLPETVFLVWNNEKIPVLKAHGILVLENLQQVTAVAPKTFLVSEHMDRIAAFDELGAIKLYSVA